VRIYRLKNEKASPVFSNISSALTWFLLGIGFLLVCFAGTIGQELVPARNGIWSLDEARGLAASAPIIGSMIFAAGLTISIVAAIRDLKDK
jgi:hypothetical protein